MIFLVQADLAQKAIATIAKLELTIIIGCLAYLEIEG